MKLTERLRNLKLFGEKKGAEMFEFNRVIVLCYIFENEKEDLRVILTKRSSMPSSNSGDVSNHTTLREAKEEIDLDLSCVNVVAILEQIVLKNGTFVVLVMTEEKHKDAEKFAFEETKKEDEDSADSVDGSMRYH
ncbi:nudix hydrolase 11-like [Impatiens glandulifera]|uniref:nudix hydrolase 11-like n=1 Tax=Impatiens glandulifera TaxID=253017 RepID=UPI001FB0C526|nr:nudix hydrolase 11-like [Impatiens glandulifera]